jgi:uncharacterized membrane protein YphA (DoxX/SURF4 family)
MKALLVSHYLYAVKCFEISGGLLLLSGRFTALGLTLVGPVIVNILFFHTFLDPSGLHDGDRAGRARVVPTGSSPSFIRGIASQTIASDKNDHC